jgi:bifunctional non-homologous end joining protein LigD
MAATRATAAPDESRARHVEVTNPSKVLFPADGITKADVAGYYRTVARICCLS